MKFWREKEWDFGRHRLAYVKYFLTQYAWKGVTHPMCEKLAPYEILEGEEWDFGDDKKSHLLFVVVTEKIVHHSMCLKFGDDKAWCIGLNSSGFY